MLFSSTAGSDYNSTVMELMFSATARRHVVRIPIINDSFSERTERFTASLSLVENNGIIVVINPLLAFVTIEDDDGVWACLVHRCPGSTSDLPVTSLCLFFL